MFLPILFLIVGFIILLWKISLIIAVIGGAPTVYSKRKVIKLALDGTNLKKGQILLDLGCGNARTLIFAAKNYKVKGIGVEISPFAYLASLVNVLFSGESKNVKIYFGNFRSRANLINKADVVYLYLFDKIVLKVEPWLIKNIKKNATVVSVAFPLKRQYSRKITNQPMIYYYDL